MAAYTVGPTVHPNARPKHNSRLRAYVLKRSNSTMLLHALMFVYMTCQRCM